MRASTAFVSVGCNRVVNALDWGECGLIAYGGSCIVCVYDPEAARIVATLPGHTGQVNCVKWVPAAAAPALPAGCSLLLSGAADNTVRVWAWLGADAAQPAVLLAELTDASTPITSLAVHAASPGSFVVVATSADPHVHLWSCSHAPDEVPAPTSAQAAGAAATGGGPASAPQQLQRRCGAAAWRLEQQLHVGTALQHCAALTQLPGCESWLLLATGGTDSRIRLFTRPPGSGGVFELACELAGHDDWVRGVAFAAVASEQAGYPPELLMASASQDRYSRVWCIRREGSQQLHGASAAAPAADDFASLITRYAPRPQLRAGAAVFTASLESLLIGHEDWVHTVSWSMPLSEPSSSTTTAAPGAGERDGAGLRPQPRPPPPPPRAALQLVSSSQDRTMMLWRYEADSALWVNQAIVGDAGATCFGYYGGLFSPDGGSLLAHGFTGALHLWQRQQHDDGLDLWRPRHAQGGHFGAVVDVAWGADGRCVQSASCDQTARLFTDVNGHWCELARTQVHGHDFSCLAPIPCTAPGAATAAYKYASGSEEKMVRVLEAPTAFLDTLALARGRQPSLAAAPQHSAAAGDGGDGGRAFGAAVGALSLSNKAVYGPGPGGAGGAAATPAPGGGAFDLPEGPDVAPSAAPAAVSGPPLEEHLAQSTLWPEVRKLYGHGSEVHCLAASPDGRWLASACRAQSAASAAVWVWEVASWRPAAQLAAHTLTVTQLAFSHSGAFLVAGSRDRSFSVWAVPSSCSAADSADRTVAGDDAHAAPAAEAPAAGTWALLARVKAAHARIVWGVAWAPDDRFIVTCSRDQTVKLWLMTAQGPSQHPCLTVPPFAAAVTAVDVTHWPCGASACALIAVGLESGAIEVWRCVDDDGDLRSVEQVWRSDNQQMHAAAVRRLAWQHQSASPAPAPLLLASCGNDHAVRVLSLTGD